MSFLQNPLLAHAVPELSIVIPCYNEIDNIAAITAAVDEVARLHTSSHEIILIDNRSTDGTREEIRVICATNPRVRAIFNNRNYGQMRSPTHGIYAARGRAVIGMCADFQDPPQMIGTFINHWRKGAPIVLAQRSRERTGPLLGLARWFGYFVLAHLADYPVFPNVTGFGLFDREVVDTLRDWVEPEPFFRGMLAESGFPVTLVPFDRPQRAAGTSKNGPAALFGFAVSGLSGSAKGLLRLPITLAIAMAVLTLGLLIGTVGCALVGNPLGWPLAATTGVSAMFATVLLFLGLIGDQVRLLTERARCVPLVIEECRINFPGHG